MEKKVIWQIEVYNLENKRWRTYGSPSSSFKFAYSGMKKLAEIGYKTRIKKVVMK